MYLLQAEANDIPFMLFIGILSLIIFYYIIRGAVSSGTKELKDQLRLQNKLKVREMKREGYTNEEIMEDIKAINR
jgi:hypothetical protein